MPHIQKLHQDLADRDDVIILALNRGDDKDVVAEYWADEGFTFEAVYEDEGGANADAMGVQAFPTNIVVGKDGRVLYATVGFDDEKEAYIRQLLGL